MRTADPLQEKDAWRALRVGDRVRIVRRPSNWARLHRDARRFYDRMIREQLVLTVDQIDEVGHPWVSHTRPLASGGYVFDTLAINDDSWVLAEEAAE